LYYVLGTTYTVSWEVLVVVNWQKNLWFLCAATFIANVAFTLYIPFLPTFLLELGLQENISFWSGIMVSVTFCTYALMAPVWGALADRRGKRVMLVRSGFGIAVTFMLMGLAANHWQLLLLRAANGLLSGFIPSAIMLVATNTPETHMGYALGMLNTFIAIGSIMGPFIGGALVKYMGVRQAMFATGAMLLVAAALAVFGTKERIVANQEKTSVLQDVTIVLKNRSLQLYFFCLVMLQMAAFAIQPTLPLRIAEICNEDVELYTGIIFSAIGISLAIGSPLVSRITKLSYRGILFLGLASGVVLNVLQGFTSSLLLLIGERFLYGFAHAAVNVSGNVLITMSASEEMRGRVFGVLNSFIALGGMLGPLLGGMLGETFGNASAFHGSAIFLFMAMVMLVLSYRREKGISLKASP